jgi:hypothetical protein
MRHYGNRRSLKNRHCERYGNPLQRMTLNQDLIKTDEYRSLIADLKDAVLEAGKKIRRQKEKRGYHAVNGGKIYG